MRKVVITLDKDEPLLLIEFFIGRKKQDAWFRPLNDGSEETVDIIGQTAMCFLNGHTAYEATDDLDDLWMEWKNKRADMYNLLLPGGWRKGSPERKIRDAHLARVKRYERSGSAKCPKCPKCQ